MQTPGVGTVTGIQLLKQRDRWTDRQRATEKDRMCVFVKQESANCRWFLWKTLWNRRGKILPLDSNLVLWSPWETGPLVEEAALWPSQKAWGWGPADRKPRRHSQPDTENAPAAHHAPTPQTISGGEKESQKDRKQKCVTRKKKKLLLEAQTHKWSFLWVCSSVSPLLFDLSHWWCEFCSSNRPIIPLLWLGNSEWVAQGVNRETSPLSPGDSIRLCYG